MIIIIVFLVAFFISRNGIENYINRENPIQLETPIQETQREVQKEQVEEREVKGVRVENQISFESSGEQVNSAQKNQDFVYPGSTFSGQEGLFSLYKINKPASEVTDWYETKIEEQGLNATSVVRTKTNGSVLNKLSAASSNYKIEIEITSSGAETTIRLKD